ncbi:MAG: RNA polymerase sigma factor, partial [Planctomycetaceae bacterium]|nr:RNA polymerase sigma factor [Planctomycetaceae bacterium]
MSQVSSSKTSPTDLELVERVQQAKSSPSEEADRCAHESFQLLFERHHRALLAFVLTRVVNRSIAEELVQSCWLKAWTRLGTHFHGGHFRGWMFELLRNLIIDESRKQRKKTERTVSLQEYDQDFKSSSEDIVQQREDRLEALQDCLAELEEPRGEIVRY